MMDGVGLADLCKSIPTANNSRILIGWKAFRTQEGLVGELLVKLSMTVAIIYDVSFAPKHLSLEESCATSSKERIARNRTSHQLGYKLVTTLIKAENMHQFNTRNCPRNVWEGFWWKSSTIITIVHCFGWQFDVITSAAFIMYGYVISFPNAAHL